MIFGILWYFKIISNFTLLTVHEISYKRCEISLVVFMPNITANHSITYTNVAMKLPYKVKFFKYQLFWIYANTLLCFEKDFIQGSSCHHKRSCHLSETDWSAKEERCVPDLSRVHLTLGWLLGPLVWLAHQIKHDGYEPVAPETDLELFFTKSTTFPWVEIFNSAQLQTKRCQNLLKVSRSASFIPKDTIAWQLLKNWVFIKGNSSSTTVIPESNL